MTDALGRLELEDDVIDDNDDGFETVTVSIGGGGVGRVAGGMGSPFSFSIFTFVSNFILRKSKNSEHGLIKNWTEVDSGVNGKIGIYSQYSTF